MAAGAFLITVLVRRALPQADPWTTLLRALAGIVVAAMAVWALRRGSAKVKIPLPPELQVPKWIVDRPAGRVAVVKALLGSQDGVVGIYGPGGSGKTTLAQLVCADRRVKRRFGGRVYLVTLGRNVRGAAAISAKVNVLIKSVAGEDATFTDPELAGRRLGSLLDAGPRMLLILDNVWDPEQLGPFTIGGSKCARLVLTRVPDLLAGHRSTVQVAEMPPEQARTLLTCQLQELNPAVVQGLLAVTGRWPLLLRLVNCILADYARMAMDVPAQGAALLERLRASTPSAADDLFLYSARRLDVKLAWALQGTIAASTSMLYGHDTELFTELGIFAEDDAIPFSLVARLWRATAGLDERQAAQVCEHLTQLGLVSQAAGAIQGITLHHAVRELLRGELRQQRLAVLNGLLLDIIAADLPRAPQPDPAARPTALVAWWEMGSDDRYLWDHLIEHLLDAGRPGEANAVAGDLRWVGARLERFGPAAPATDLSATGTPRAARLQAALAGAAHMLAPTEPAGAVVHALHSRVADDPDWGPQVSALCDVCGRPQRVNRWQLLLAGPTLGLMLAGHTGWIRAVAVAPDGSWLATGGSDNTVRIWDTATGQQRAVLTGHTGEVEAVAIAPDGSWLATGGWDKTVRIWDMPTGQQRAVLTGHTRRVGAVAIAPDGSWLATGGWDKTVRIWDMPTGQQRAVLTGHTRWVGAVAIAPDGSWLATGGSDNTVRIWDMPTGQQRAVLTGHTRRVETVAIAPDGSWLATGGSDNTVRIWDMPTGQQRAVLTGHTGQVEAVAIAPDGSWLATSSWDKTVRIWDPAIGKEAASLSCVNVAGAVVVAPDGSWLATGGDDGTARIWDMPTGQQQGVLNGDTGWVQAVSVAPDGSWLATGGDDGTARIWDMPTGQQRAVLTGHTGWVQAVAAAPDGSWLATGGTDDTVRIWDTATGQQRAVLTGHTGWGRAVAAAPDGSWLATSDMDETVMIWEMPTGQRAVLTGDTGWVQAVAVAPDGSWLATGGTDETVRIWDMPTGQQRAVLTGHTGWVQAVAVAPDGSWLATGSTDETVRIWDMPTGQQRAVLTGHTGWVQAVAAAPDGSWLATGSWDKTVRIWDMPTGQQRAVLTGHTGLVGTVVAAPDGSWLATGDDDGTVRIWNMPTGLLRAMTQVDGAVTAATWRGSNLLIVGGSSGLYLLGFLPGAGWLTPPADDASAGPAADGAGADVRGTYRA